MIREITLKHFKQFATLNVKLPGHVVFVGPNNAGKTTVLQAIAAWDLAFRRWRDLNDTAKRGGTYMFCAIARPDFLAVPLPMNALDLLWTGRDSGKEIEITIRTDGWRVTMEFRFDKEQVRVRPVSSTTTGDIESVDLRAVFVPPMGGLAPEEPQYARDEFIEGRFAEGRPGEVLRNLLYQASLDAQAWNRLGKIIRRLFGFELDQPRAGKFLSANYRIDDGEWFDLVSAGSGFQQILMLLTVLSVRPGTVLLIDEPDAHLHVILQDAIFHELHEIAKDQRSQLLLSTHSEVIINAVDVTEMVVMPGASSLADESARRTLVQGLGMLSNTDLMLAKSTPGVLYVEGHTDLELLRSWAMVLAHPALDVLTKRLFWHSYSIQARPDAPGFAARDHFTALQMHVSDLKGLEIQDRDGNQNLAETAITGSGLHVIRWRRYEIESYLLHPGALERFVYDRIGKNAPDTHRTDLRAKMGELLTADFVANAMAPTDPAQAVLESRKARVALLPPILDAAGLPGFPYTSYHEIAALMRPDEIHPEVTEKLDAICTAFGLPLEPPADGVVP